MFYLTLPCFFKINKLTNFVIFNEFYYLWKRFQSKGLSFLWMRMVYKYRCSILYNSTGTELVHVQSLTMFLNSTVLGNISVLNRIENKTASLPLIIFAVSVCAFIIIFNLCSIFVVILLCKEKQRKKYLNILSLSVTHMMVGITMIPLGDTYWNSNQHFTYYGCWSRYVAYSLFFTVSILHIFGLCFQHVLVLYEKMSRTCSYRKNVTIILSIWCVGIVITLIEFTLWSSNRDLTECSLDNLFRGHADKIFFLISIIWFIIQLAVLLCMVILFIFVYKYRKYSVRAGIRRASAKDCNMCLTTLLIAGIVLVFDWPFTIILICEGMDSNVTPWSSRNTRTVSMLFSGLNSTINPVIYVYRTQRLRNRISNLYTTFKQCFTRKPGKRLNVQNEQTSAAMQTFRGIEDEISFQSCNTWSKEKNEKTYALHTSKKFEELRTKGKQNIQLQCKHFVDWRWNQF